LPEFSNDHDETAVELLTICAAQNELARTVAYHRARRRYPRIAARQTSLQVQYPLGGHAVATSKTSHRYIRLPNALEALLIHDATADVSAAALDCRVGHFSDPGDLPGLAHLTEHMLFLGTAKYPEEDYFRSYLSQHGGSTNASTSTENTRYHFDVSAEYLQEGLDIFAAFFTAPLLRKDSIEREMKAVDSENGKNLLLDNFRLYQLEKSTASPLHPFHKFGTGNLSTLGNDPLVHERMAAFYRTHYSASVMKLAVLGRESLDELEALVACKFGEIPNSNIAPPSFESLEPFTSELLARKFCYIRMPCPSCCHLVPSAPACWLGSWL
jgi:insulysin